MSEIVTSILNKNSMMYSEKFINKNEGPACVDGKGEIVQTLLGKPAEAPLKAVREK